MYDKMELDRRCTEKRTSLWHWHCRRFSMDVSIPYLAQDEHFSASTSREPSTFRLFVPVVPSLEEISALHRAGVETEQPSGSSSSTSR